MKISLLMCLLHSCKKEKEEPGTASLGIVNAVADSRPLVYNFNAEGLIQYSTIKGQSLTYSYYMQLNPFRGYMQFSSFSGMQRVRLFQYPDTAIKDMPLFDVNLDLPVSSVNTLFLTGTTTAPDVVFSRDTIPYFEPVDSLIAIRFINLSPGSRPVNINLEGNADGLEISNLEYKQISGFKNYSLKSDITSSFFEFRDAATGDLLTSFPFIGLLDFKPSLVNPSLTFTIVFQGWPGGADIQAQSVQVIPHFHRN